MAQAALTSLLTVLAGVAVFVVGQVALVLFIERIRTQGKTIEEIARALVIFARETSSVVPLDESMNDEVRQRFSAASQRFRELAGVLRATATTLRWYPLFEALRLVLPKKDVIEASKCLIGLSNSCPPRSHDIMMLALAWDKEIKRLLRVEI